MARIDDGDHMNARVILRIGAIGLLLAAAGFILAIGTLTLVFAPGTGYYAPVTSSDAAAWFQAVGSALAIAASYWLGERQAGHARKQAEQVRTETEKATQDAQLAVITVLHNAGKLFEAADRDGMYAFRYKWEKLMKHNVRAALDAFDAIPLHEMKSGARVLAAVRVRSAVQAMYDVTAANVDAMDLKRDPASEAAFEEVLNEIQTQASELEDAWADVVTQWQVNCS